MSFVAILLCASAGILAVPTLVFAIECLVGALAQKRMPSPEAEPAGELPRVVVLVPAHDEATGIADTLAALRREVGRGMRLVVIADNCSDDTASIARTAGVEVIERVDPERRGKGYALSFALEAFAPNPPDVVVIIDADCRVAPRALDQLVARAMQEHRPAQADYSIAPRGASPMSSISAFAFVVRNRTRPRGLAGLGLPCHLAGTGMAIPWDLLRSAAPTGSHLVEDLVMGLDLALRGYPPTFVAEARVSSVLPASSPAELGQRRRWETGRLAILPSAVAKLTKAAVLERRADLLALALDMTVPPMALHTTLLFAGTGLAVLSGTFGLGWAAALAFAAELTLVAIGVFAAWLRDGRELLTFTALLRIPIYLLWKLPIYSSFLRRGAERTWVRTDREPPAT